MEGREARARIGSVVAWILTVVMAVASLGWPLAVIFGIALIGVAMVFGIIVIVAIIFCSIVVMALILAADYTLKALGRRGLISLTPNGFRFKSEGALRKR